jgi:uncharacterized protein (TIGR00266 family)
MRFEVQGRPGSALATVFLDAGEEVLAERGAMMGMSAHVTPSTTLFGAPGQGAVGVAGALLGSSLRRLMGGESGVINRFVASKDGEVVMLAPTLPGDIAIGRVTTEEPMFLNGASWLASGRGVDVSVLMAGTGAVLGGQEFYVVHCQGDGEVAFYGYGAIEPIEVDGSYLVDGRHLIAWQGPLRWRPRVAARSIRAALISGERIVVEFRGRGKVWVQTRALPDQGGAFIVSLPWS